MNAADDEPRHYVIARHRPHNCGDDHCENHGKVFPSPNGPLLHVLDLPDAEHIHVTRHPDGTITAVAMRRAFKNRTKSELWDTPLWVDAEGGAA